MISAFLAQQHRRGTFDVALAFFAFRSLCFFQINRQPSASTPFVCPVQLSPTVPRKLVAPVKKRTMISNFDLWSTAIYVVAGFCSYICYCVYVYRFHRTVDDTVARDLLARDEEATAEEDAQARYRLTASRLKKAIPESGEFDVVLIGSGPGSMGCAAALARMGKKCCVLEQGEQLGGGSHVFSEAGYEFETGVHYLGNDKAMISLLDFLSCGR